MIAFIFFCGKVIFTPYPFPDIFLFPKVPEEVRKSVTIEGASLGRLLFYDPVLSMDSTVSCSSCHDPRFAFSDPQKTFSLGVGNGKTARNARPLFNLAWQRSFFYDGRASNLPDQVSHPITARNEMNMNWQEITRRLNSNKGYKQKFGELFKEKRIDSNMVKDVVSQFLFTLISSDSKFDRVMAQKDKFNEEEFRGFGLINNQTRADCLHCHPTDGNGLMTTFAFSNNGLDSVFNPEKFKDKGRGGVTGKNTDNGKFMIPSLRNIALTGPYMHDGRFKTLEEVMEFYSSGVHLSANVDSKMGFAYQKGAKLSEREKKDIIAFLHTLTDSVFISNAEFSNPHK